ncbi:MAG TPA: hypothetical protein VMV86_03895 [Methanosarcinales archaeon]|nr:hypothetical protein [Methanosarcinales archaeon]
MKIQINATGQIVDEPLNRAQRMINKGIAHVVKEEVKPVVKPVVKPIEKPVIKVVKELPKVVEIDLIEPIPERFVSFEDEPKVSKPIWKSKKKKSKEKITDEDNS